MKYVVLLLLGKFEVFLYFTVLVDCGYFHNLSVKERRQGIRTEHELERKKTFPQMLSPDRWIYMPLQIFKT